MEDPSKTLFQETTADGENKQAMEDPKLKDSNKEENEEDELPCKTINCVKKAMQELIIPIEDKIICLLETRRTRRRKNKTKNKAKQIVWEVS